MKLNAGTVVGITLFCLAAGTLTWEIIEQFAEHVTGVSPQLAVGPYGFDIGVLAIWIRLNPGSVLGIPIAIVLLRRL